ncbi:MAG TPA: hypothetical protein DCQ06_14040 [Myxococcales bacterium]|nr:hypothetical protein [Myxococcales bacterium]HAN32709.1 hypothetical protein [Myxococcales bacterium]
MKTPRSLATKPTSSSKPQIKCSALQAAAIVARRLTSDPGQRDDLAADALLGWIEHAKKRGLSSEEMYTNPNWVVLRCRAIDRWRKVRTQTTTLQRFQRDPALNSSMASASVELLDLNRILTKVSLSADDRAVLQVVYVAGETLQQLADQQGWSHATARRRHHTCLSRLRQTVGLDVSKRFNDKNS